MNVFSQQYVDQLYLQYQQDPGSLSSEWQAYFSQLEAASEGNEYVLPSDISASENGAGSHIHNPAELSVAQLQDRVDQLVRGFRVRGHLEARIDPLGMPRPTNRELNPDSYSLSAEDMDKMFSARTINGEDYKSLREIVEQLRNTYCRSIGAQFMHIDDHSVRDWLQKRMEGSSNRIELDRHSQIRILNRLTDAVIFEEFVRRKFMGAKTFSLEGAETLIPLLDRALEKAGEHGIVEVVLGMAHRGRLNVLANIMGKRTENIFWSFDDPDPVVNKGAGDVIYHMGHSCDWTTSAGKNVHISLCFNPSHLEFVNPVAMGRCRAKQDRVGDNEHSQVLNILIHGDAAFAGEGVVQETLNMSQLAGYKCGGTLHVIVNNQIGFTTLADDSRSTTYASDVAKMLQIPIFHVNGEDPEAVAQVIELAMEFRKRFKRDVVIDMYCYRRHGHNESDEPRFTQPVMYKTIDSRKTIRDSYLERLLAMGGITREEAEEIAGTRKAKLQRDLETAQKEDFVPDTQTLGGYWNSYFGGQEPTEDSFPDDVKPGKLTYVIQKTAEMPEGFSLHPKLQRIFGFRKEMAEGKRRIDWATAELAAFGSLAIEGHPVRLSGQDCGRGTFSQRHAVLHDVESGTLYTPLKHLADDQANVEIINSPLCETGVLGFDYGYSLDMPEALVVWEAQFGDFYNVAQVVFDQFIASAEDKWRRLSGLVMMLPHGFEGGGPEHCSGRLERFLTLTAEHNFQIAYPTTAAQHFHLLRRQVKRKWRKPLVILTPKSLLREDVVTSSIEEFTNRGFEKILGDPDLDGSSVKHIVLSTGKIGVELIKERRKRERDDIAVIRMEQLYPLPLKELEAVLQQYPAGTPVTWVQEEPTNMGAWYFVKINFGDQFFERWPLAGKVSRPESASPSTGSKKAHKIEHEELMDSVFNLA